MKIQVGLLDGSEIIKKMLSHCLHYFVINLHAFKTWDECLLNTHNQNLNILFIDWDMSHGNDRLIDLAQQKLHSIPTVLMHRQEAEKELFSRNPKLTPHRIKKPLNPKIVREVFSKIVPQVQKDSIHSFLQYPKAPLKKNAAQENKNQAPSRIQTPTSPNSNQMIPIQDAPNLNLQQMPSSESRSNLTLNPQNKPSVQTASGEAPQNSFSSLSRDAKTQKQDISLETPTQETLQKNYLDQTASKYVQKSDPSASSISYQTKKIDKSNIVLDEDTQNDLAPMAIKSSSAQKEPSLMNLQILEHQILEVLKKYKDSLEFTKIMEKVLSDYAKETIQNILEPDQTKNIIKESLQDFQEGENFKKQVDEEIQSQIKVYVKEELPFKIKSIIQEEIKKILSN